MKWIGSRRVQLNNQEARALDCFHALLAEGNHTAESALREVKSRFWRLSVKFITYVERNFG